MPYFIRTTQQPVRFPPRCSSCCGDGPLILYHDDHSQATGAIPLPGSVHITARRTDLDFPICTTCGRRSSRLKILSFCLMFLPWIGVCISPTLSDDKETQGTLALVTGLFALGSAVAGIFLLVHAHRGIRNLKIVYASPDEIVLSSKSQAYAEEFANLNGVVAEKRAVYIRFR